VLNDDCIQAGHGFGKHPHDNMEIVTIPLTGSLKHADSTGNEGVITAGDVQIMSAGSGILHAEFNASETESATLFQIWVYPKQLDIEPRYDQRTFSETDRYNKWQVLVHPDAIHNALWINQDASFSLGNFDADTSYKQFFIENVTYIMVIEGEVVIDANHLSSRDAIGIMDATTFEINVLSPAKLLAIEVPKILN
jgi:redox-sensitive bicupin YhaK (pirin superfamily)